VGLVSCIAAWVDDNGQVFSHFPGLLFGGGQYPQDKADLVRYLYVAQNKVVNAGCMFRRTVVETQLNPFDEQARHSIDWQFFLHLAHSHLIVGIPEVLIRMRRGEQHTHLTKDKELLYFETRRCIRTIFHKYRWQRDSPVDYWLYRRAMASQLTLEGRYYGRLKGTIRLLQALFYDPLARPAWSSLAEFAGRAMRRTVRGWKTPSW